MEGIKATIILVRQFFFQIAILVIVILGGLYISTHPAILDTGIFNWQNRPVQTEAKRLVISDPTNTNVKSILNIEIADTKEKRAKGLGGRDSLATDSGMMFTFDKPGQYQFWMKGMRIPLDFIWVNDNKVVDLLQNILPPEVNQADNTLPIYAPVVSITQMIEVNAGFINANNIQIGDKVGFLESVPTPIPTIFTENYPEYSPIPENNYYP